MRRRRTVSAVVLLFCLGGLTALPAARSEAAMVVAEGQPAAWSGQPPVETLLPERAVCALGPSDPTCVHQELDVRPGPMPALEIVVVADDRLYDDFDIVIFDDQGTRIAEATSAGWREVLTMRATDGLLTVSVSAYGTTLSGTFRATATLTGGEPRSTLTCSDAIPESPAPVDAVPNLSVLTLVDGISIDRATAIVDRAQATWRDAGINLTVAFDDTFRSSSYAVGRDHQGRQRPRANSQTLFAEAKAHVGGAPPDPHDAVIVLTDRDLNDNGSEYMGVANCIGALADPEMAFGLAEGWADVWQSPLGTQPDLSSIIWSHELGHLVNAPHHYDDCTFGATRAGTDGRLLQEEECSLMQYLGGPGSGKLTTMTLYFGPVNREVVRAHVQRFASR